MLGLVKFGKVRWAVAKLLEQQVTVVSNVELPKGVQIHPAQGTVRCGKLEIYSTLPDNDVSAFFRLIFSCHSG